MVMRPALIAEGLEKVRRGRYLTIFAPRQAGKTTFFQLLIKELRKEEKYTPIWISFEDLQDTAKKEFYEVLGHELSAELAERGIQTNRAITSPVTLSRFFEELRRQCPAVVLVIDEFEGVSKQALSGLLHSFRKIYHKRERHALHSLILVGVSTLADLIVSSASPFNITDELEISYFSFDEINNLIGQYKQESGQKFEAQVIQAIYENTAGQPGLVNGLCAHLVEQVAIDRTKPVTMDDFY